MRRIISATIAAAALSPAAALADGVLDWAYPYEIAVAEAYNSLYCTDFSTTGYSGLVALVEARGELHPHSDIDLLILLRESNTDAYRDSIEQFLMLLWDIGLEVGQSVRSISECQEEARNDITVITNLMESRTLSGDESLRQAMIEALSAEHMWTDAEFFRAKRAEQQRRHAKFHDTE